MKDIDFAFINQTDGLTTYPRLHITKADGVKRLSNLFIKLLFTEPFTSLSFPYVGGNILSLRAQKLSERDRQLAVVEIMNIIEKVEAQIKNMQKGKEIPSKDTLKAIKILNVVFRTPAYLRIEVELSNVDGDITDITLPVYDSSKNAGE